MVATSGKSFKGSDQDLINSQKQWSRVDLILQNDSQRSVKIQTLSEQKTQKTFLLDGNTKSRLNYSQKMPTVLFEPEHMNILSGDPGGRRDYLDFILCKTHPTYESVLKNYKRALLQRNTLLKKHTLEHQQLFVWDLRLSELGGVIHDARGDLIQSIDQEITKQYQSISGKKDKISAVYVTDSQSADYRSSLLSMLASSYHKDKERGFTTKGPHRDDFYLTLNSIPAEHIASRGETRSLLLAVKIIEIKLIENVLGKPLLLFDDVFSELDGHRRRALAAAVSDYQTLITTTDADVVLEYFMQNTNVIALA